MSLQEKKRERVSDLLDAEIDKETIAKIVGVSVATVYNVAKAKKDGNGTERASGSGTACKRRLTAFVDDLKAKVKNDPTVSARQMARDMDVSHTTILMVLKADLGLTSFVRTLRHLLTDKIKVKRLDRCGKIRNFLCKGQSLVVIFSDKKIFTMDQVVNCWNNHWLEKSKEEVQGVFRMKHLAQVMVLGVVASDGRTMLPYFFPAGEKIYCHAYICILRYSMLPWLKANYPNSNYVWT